MSRVSRLFSQSGYAKAGSILRSDPVRDPVRRSDVSPINLKSANRTGGTSDRHPLGVGAWDFSSKGLTAWYRARVPSAFTVNTSVTISGLTTSKGMLNKRTKVMSAANPLIV